MATKTVHRTKNVKITVSSRGTNTYVKDRGKWKNTKSGLTKSIKRK